MTDRVPLGVEWVAAYVRVRHAQARARDLGSPVIFPSGILQVERVGQYQSQATLQLLAVEC
jgi:hypothetical protein